MESFIFPLRQGVIHSRNHARGSIVVDRRSNVWESFMVVLMPEVFKVDLRLTVLSYEIRESFILNLGPENLSLIVNLGPKSFS